MTERGAWINGGSYSAEDDRQLIAALMTHDSAGTAGIPSARTGVIISGRDPLRVQQRATPNMSVDLLPGRSIVHGDSSPLTQGSYLYTNDTTKNIAISAANATLPRRDLIVIQVNDQQYSGSTNGVAATVLTGTPAASPVAPAIPAGNSYQILAEVLIPAGSTSVTNANIMDRREYTVSVGGLMPVPNQSALPAAPYRGQQVWRTDLNRISVWNGTSWENPVPYEPTPYFERTSNPGIQLGANGNGVGGGSVSMTPPAGYGSSDWICTLSAECYGTPSADLIAHFGLRMDGFTPGTADFASGAGQLVFLSGTSSTVYTVSFAIPAAFMQSGGSRSFVARLYTGAGSGTLVWRSARFLIRPGRLL